MRRLIYMKSLIAKGLLLSVVFIAFPSFAQQYDKMSSGTQMFLSERNGETMLPRRNVSRAVVPRNDTLVRFVDPTLREQEMKRPIAETEIYDGQEMISAFVRVNDGNFSSVVALGAVIQSQFKDGLAAMLLPVDKIEAISELSNVTYIEVAEVLKPVNDRQRTVTQAIDAIANSEAAQALGINSGYTGKGVILGVIDTGVDFQHIAFKDKNGNNRIVRAYKLSGSNSTSLTTYSSTSQINALTYDTNAEDHGTHTSTTAGGSSVVVSGSTVTVTDDHANATYGGMAPEADLVIAGLSSLYTTSIGTAIQNICNYADQVSKPCVISLSLGSQVGPHDGTGTIASIVDQYAGNNHIIVYAASNDGMRAAGFDGADGGMYASGTSSSSKPMLVNVQRNFSNADGNVEMLMPTITAYARTAGVPTSLKFHVVNVNTGAVVYSSSAYTSSTTIDLTGSSGLAAYYRSSSSYSNQYGDAGKIRITRTQDSNNNKYYWQIYAPIMLSTSYADNDGDGVYNSDYAFCVSVYPTSTSSSTIIDMWENTYCWFGTDLNISSSSYNYCKGNDDCSVSDNACYAKAISVGAYVTKNSITDYAGTAHDYSSEYPNIGDHASFSSWQSTGYGPLGTALPHINAPGARIVAGVNHYHTKSVDDYSYWSNDFIADLVVNNSNYPYAAMEGTSMATPCVSGIVAQWLQACVESGKTPTPDYIKEVMAATWDTDEWTNGTGAGAHGAKTFGTHGKINAIKGIQYILGCSGGPVITATPTEVAFDATDVGAASPTKTFNVKGVNLQGNITLTLNDPNGVFSLDATTVTQTQAAAGKDITVTFTPKAAANYQATVTLASTGAEAVTVTLTGTGKVALPFIMAEPEELLLQAKLNEPGSGKFTVMGENLTGDVTLTLGDPDGVFSLDKFTITKAQAEAVDGCEVNVTFTPLAMTDYNTTVTISSPGAESVTIALNGSPLKPYFIFEPDELTFNAATDESVSKTLQILAENIYGDIELSLDDPSGVFSLSTTSIPAAEAEDMTEVTVTFYAETEGTYEGYILLATPWGEEDEYVKLTATVNNGGTASDSYLNIAKYATIDTAGWNTTYVNKLYQYKEYSETNEGWLTLPIYGAWSSVYYSPKAQNWIKTNVTSTSNKYAGTSWDSNAELMGSSVYFTGTSGNGSARAMGYNSRDNYTQETVTFYVTNITAVKLLGLGQSRASSYTPASLKVYECTKNDDGSLIDGTSAVKSYTNSLTSGTFVLSATGLDETKIYKVEAATYRSYIAEIGFCTPLPETVTLSQLVSDGVEKKAYNIQDGNLRAVMLSPDYKKLYCKDDNDYAQPSEPQSGEIDYARDKAKFMTGFWDQSNWVALQLDNGAEWSDFSLVGYQLKNVTGKLKNKTNPVFAVNSKSLPEAYSNEKNNYLEGLHNIFITCNMVSISQQGSDGNNYFFVAPKPMEIAEFRWAFWDGEKFVVPPYVEGQINELQFRGGFYVDMSELLEEQIPTLYTNHVYQFTGLIKRETATSSRLNASRDVPEVSTDYVVYPLAGMDDVGSIVDNVITGVNDLIPGKTVKAMRYFDTLGRTSTRPFTGINIIEVEYTDGTRQIMKKLLK